MFCFKFNLKTNIRLVLYVEIELIHVNYKHVNKQMNELVLNN